MDKKPEAMNGQIVENNVGILSTWERLCLEKAENVKNSQINSVKEQLRIVPFVWNEIEKSKGDSCYLGNYGYLVDESRDFEINQIFRAWEIIDEESEPVNVGMLRKKIGGKKGEERKFILNDPSEKIQLEINFLSGDFDINFDCWISGVDDGYRKKLSEHIQGLGVIKALDGLAEQFENPDKEVGVMIDEEQERYLYHRLGMKNGNQEMWPGFGIEIKRDDRDFKIKWDLSEELINGSLDEKQFLKSQTAKDFLGVMDVCGLVPSRYMISAISEGGCGGRNYSSRYGSGFSELSRVVTSLFGNAGVERLFDIEENEEDEEDVRTSEEIVKKIRVIKEVMSSFEIDEGAKLILEQISGLVLRDGKGENDFRYYSSRLGLHGNGACEDSESYLVSEVGDRETNQDENFVYFYGGSRVINGSYDVFDGYMLAMSRREISVNGVDLPPGFLCRVSEDGMKVEPVRASMFCFEEDEAQKIFGKQYEKFFNSRRKFNVGRNLILF